MTQTLNPSLSALTGSSDTKPQTRPDYFPAFGTGLGIVPRRGWDAATNGWLLQVANNPVEGLRRWATTAPSRMLAVLSETHPLFALARSNDLALAFSPGDTHIVAVETKTTVGDDGEPISTDQIDSDGTAALDALWSTLPPEAGGLLGLQETLYDQFSSCGMCVCEGVPGPRGTGLSQVLTADPLTFRYCDTAGGRVLQQMQGGEPVTMDPLRVRAVPHRGNRDNPYGVPRLSAALREGLRDLKHQGNLDDVLYEVAWPRLSWGFPLNETVKFATENPEVLAGQGAGGGDATPTEWAFLQFKAFSDAVTHKRHDDNFGYIEGGKIAILSGAEGLEALDPTLQMLRLRLCSALLQLPTLMGMDPGGTLAFSSTQYKAFAKKLEHLRWLVNSVLAWVATRHLRLLGLPLTARVDVEPIQTSDGLADEQTRQLQIANELELFDNGLITDKDLAMNMTGSGVADAEKLAKRGQSPPSVPVPEPATVPVEPTLPQPVPSK